MAVIGGTELESLMRLSPTRTVPAAVIDVARALLVQDLAEEAWSLAVDIDAGDVQFRDEPAGGDEVLVQVRWWPRSYVAVCVGGQLDGLAGPVEDPSAPIRCGVAGEDGTVRVVTYEMTGWDTVARRWVYSAVE